MRRIRQSAITSATTVTIARRPIAAVPCGDAVADQPLRRVVEQADEDGPRLPRRRQLGDAGEGGAQQALDEEHERQRPHRGAPGDAPDGDEHRHVGDAADRSGDERRAGARRRPGDHRGDRTRRRDRDERDERTTEPAAEHDLPGGRRRQPGEVERAGTHLGAEHRVADHERGDGHHEPEDALGRDVGERPIGGAVDGSASSPNSSAPTHGNRIAAHRFGGRHDCRCSEDRPEARPWAADGDVVGALIARAPGTGSRASRRADAPRAGGSTRRCASRGKRGRDLAGLQRLHDELVAPASNVTPATESSPTSAAASRRGSSARTSTWRGPVVHRVADRPLTAGRGQPTVHQHDHPLGHPLDLVEHVRADDDGAAARAPSCLNSAMRCRRCTGSAPFSGSSSTSTSGR